MDKAMEEKKAAKIREGLLLVLGVEKKDTKPLNTQITICQTEIREDNMELTWFS